MTALAEPRLKTAAAHSPNGAALKPKRRWWLIVGGLLLVLVFSGIFAVIQLGGDARVQVLAVARPIAAGHAITAEDLRIVGVVPDPSTPLVRATDASTVIGRSTAIPLAEGTLLTESQLGPSAWPASGQAVVAVALKPGRVPIGLAPGSHVRVVSVAKEGDAAAPSAGAVSVAASVVGVTAGVDGSGTSVVSLLLSQEDATKVAGAGSELALVLVAG